MNVFFFWSGVVLWTIIGPVLAALLLFVLAYWWRRVFLPSIGNLLFACFGLNRFTTLWYCNRDYADQSYYNLWKSVTGWQYRFFTRGEGRRNFGRLAMAALVRRARKEYQREFGKSIVPDINKENVKYVSVVPLFSVGDRIRLKENYKDAVGHTIVNIQDGFYWCDGSITIPISKETLYIQF